MLGNMSAPQQTPSGLLGLQLSPCTTIPPAIQVDTIKYHGRSGGSQGEDVRHPITLRLRIF